MLRTVLQLCLLGALPGLIFGQAPSTKIVCFFDSRSYFREGAGKFLAADLEHSLSMCTHIIYGYAIIDADYKLNTLFPLLDGDEGKGIFRTVTSLKERYKGKILLSVGGWADVEGEREKYMTLLRDRNQQGNFISSTRDLLKTYGFDGIDLAWQFPEIRIKPRNTLSSIWHKIKKTLRLTKGNKDPKAAEHKAGFTSLIKQLNFALNPEGHLVTASVLPHTNYSIYFDPKEISSYVDAIHVFAFDFITPERRISPEVADYAAPLYTTVDRNPEYSVDSMVFWFLNHSLPASKLILGIPTHARTWKLEKNTASGMPPLEAAGPGAPGQLTGMKGILSYPEVCDMLQKSNNQEGFELLTKVTEPTNKLGTYAYRLHHEEREGLWVAYEDLDTVKRKTAYARNKGLGGLAVVDITMDDFKGVCHGDRFPILKAIKDAL